MQIVTLIGNLGKDIEERSTPSGKVVHSFSLAVKVKKDVTIWYDCELWEDKAHLIKPIRQFLTKGSRVCVMGNLGVPYAYIAKDGSAKVKMKMEPTTINFVGASEKPKDSIHTQPLEEELPF